MAHPRPPQGSRAWGGPGAKISSRGRHLSEGHRAEAGAEKEAPRSRMAEPGGKISELEEAASSGGKETRDCLAGDCSREGWEWIRLQDCVGNGMLNVKVWILNTEGVHCVFKKWGDEELRAGRVKVPFLSQGAEKHAPKDRLCTAPHTDSALWCLGKMKKDKIHRQALKAISKLKSAESWSLQKPVR